MGFYPIIDSLAGATLARWWIMGSGTRLDGGRGTEGGVPRGCCGGGVKGR